MCLIVCLLVQAAFYCLACSCYVNSFAGLDAHTATKRHKNNVLEADILQFSKFSSSRYSKNSLKWLKVAEGTDF
jgi:hypothetical protein